jgi:mercuric reductase
MRENETERRLCMPIGGMTCLDCEAHVSRALRAGGATEASADFRRGEARLRAPAGVSEAALAAAVREAGYAPGPIEEVATAKPAPRPTPRRRDASSRDHDLAIVGSGGGAFAAAIRARDRGARVVMIERGTIGGTCVNVGCVPSKTLLRGGDIYWQAGHNPFAGTPTTAGPVIRPRWSDRRISSSRSCARRSTWT